MPVELGTVRVYYRLGDAALTPQSARVTLRPAVPVNAPAADRGITTALVELQLDETTGYLEGRVVRSDDPALSGPMPYQLTVSAPQHYVQSVVEIVGDTDLADIAPLPEPVDVNPAYLLAAALGDTVAPLENGLVPPEHLPPASGDVYQPLDPDLTTIAGLAPTAGQVLRWAQDAWAAATLAKADVGLGDVDNTADASKPVSADQQAALDGKVSKAGDTLTGPVSVLDIATGTAVFVRSRETQGLTALLVPASYVPPDPPAPSIGRYAISAVCLETAGETSALNVTSINPAASAANVAGYETGRGTIKVSHFGGNGADGAGSALSLDLQTISGQTGTAARGIFITSTTGGTTGDLICVRHNSRDDFVVKSTGRVGIGLAIAATPGGVLEVRANDDATPTISVRAHSVSAANLLELKRASDGAVRTRISATCQLVTQETGYFTGPGVQVGSTSAQFGSGSGGMLGITNATTVPTANPSGGGVLYVEGGVLKYRGAAGVVLLTGRYPDLTELPDLTLKADLVAGKVPAAQLPPIPTTTDALVEGTTNLYFTAARAQAAAVADAINDGVINQAPSQNAVFDALAGKAASGHTHPSGSTAVLSLSEQGVLPTPVADIEQVFSVDVNGITTVRAQSPTGFVADLLRDDLLIVRNETGTTIAKGAVVHQSGVSSSSHGLPATRLPLVTLARANAIGTMPAIGLAAQDILTGSAGRVIRSGMLTGIDTSTFAGNARLWVSTTTAGGLTATEPSDLVQRIGIVVRSHATEGQLLVDPRMMLATSEGSLVPSGGTTGQALTKTSDTNWTTGWRTVRAADPPFIAGQYYFTGSQNASVSFSSAGVGTIRLVPWLVTVPTPINRLGLEVVTAGEAGAKVRALLYSDTGSGEPSAPVLDTGQLAADAAAAVEAVINMTLQPGVYWAGGVIQNVVTTQPVLRGVSSSWTPPIPIRLGTTAPALSGATIGLASTGHTGAPPNPITGLSLAGGAPRVFVRAA